MEIDPINIPTCESSDVVYVNRLTNIVLQDKLKLRVDLFCMNVSDNIDLPSYQKHIKLSVPKSQSLILQRTSGKQPPLLSLVNQKDSGQIPSDIKEISLAHQSKESEQSDLDSGIKQSAIKSSVQQVSATESLDETPKSKSLLQKMPSPIKLRQQSLFARLNSDIDSGKTHFLSKQEVADNDGGHIKAK